MSVQILEGDCRETLKTLPDRSVHCCVTSPPYFGLRDYGHDGQIGLEDSPDAFVAEMVAVFREVRRVLRNDGTLWLNLGDSYYNYRPGKGQALVKQSVSNTKQDLPQTCARRGNKLDGLKEKDLIGIPWRVAFALQADGWYLRQDIIWSKPNPMPESVQDRCTKAHEYIFLLTKSSKYFYDNEAVMEEAVSNHPAGNKNHKYAGTGDQRHRTKEGLLNLAGKEYDRRNRRSVWTVNTAPYKGAHFATFPPELIRPCILAGCPPMGKRCDCDEVILTPTGTGEIVDPSIQTGRAGMNRPRRQNEGSRPITKRQQRHEAEQMKCSAHRRQMETECGAAFAHYIRTDNAGARPLPEDIRQKFKAAGWITDAAPCNCPIEPPGIVLDPFGGSGTAAQVALEEGRSAILCELNPSYVGLIEKRMAGVTPSLWGQAA